MVLYVHRKKNKEEEEKTKSRRGGKNNKQKGKSRGGTEKNKNKKRSKDTCAQGMEAESRGKVLLFAGTISTMTCPVDGPV